jgi:hypothetical protein
MNKNNYRPNFALDGRHAVPVLLELFDFFAAAEIFTAGWRLVRLSFSIDIFFKLRELVQFPAVCFIERDHRNYFFIFHGRRAARAVSIFKYFDR